MEEQNVLFNNDHSELMQETLQVMKSEHLSGGVLVSKFSILHI